MSTELVGQAHLTIGERYGRLGLRLGLQTGLPIALLLRRDEVEQAFPLELSAALEINGRETFAPPHSIRYVDTDRLDAFRLLAPPAHRDAGREETFVVETEAGGWAIGWEYTFRTSHPRLTLRITVSPPPDAGGVLRNVRLDFGFQPTDLAGWRVEAPGNSLRPGVAADALAELVAISPAGGVRGSTGLVAIHHPGLSQTLVLWPVSRTEIGEVRLQTRGGGVTVTIETGLAGRIAGGDALEYGVIGLDALPQPWPEVRDQIAGWSRGLGIATPRDQPGWIKDASIFEVQIGFSVFAGGFRYAPYPTVKDLLADLGRIKGLGFDCLQIMPRQPYPSYNVHDYWDITTSYGDEDDLRALVATCHALGIRVILDILLHGVIDQEVMAKTAERVRNGPYFARLAEGTTGAFDAGTPALEAMHVAWSRHILDFEAHWFDGSPPRHPLAEAHPDWFMRDAEQRIIGIYTKAFDVANVAWQDYFCRAAVHLLRRLDIDGFRFDAPTYNALPNWSTATEHRASYSPLGCLELFDRLRGQLKQIKPDVVLYTEPSGVLFRQSMDITYNYDEQWLIRSVLRAAPEPDRTAVRNGRDLAAWFRDRNAVLPPDSLIAHHIDSHDTFWWPLPGEKWRREQYGVAAARALLAVFSLSGGAYMTFVGGELGLEADIQRAHRLRKSLPEVGRGRADYDAVTVDHDAVYAVVRRLGAQISVLLVNLSDQPTEVTFSLDAERLELGGGQYELYDAWGDCSIELGTGYLRSADQLCDLRLALDSFQPRLLTVRTAVSTTRST